MTRFARAVGSKSDNKKTAEDATPWEEMKKQDNEQTKVKKNKKEEFIKENGSKFKVFKKHGKKPWFDLPYEENEIMTRYKNFFVKKEIVKELDDYKKSLESEGLDKKQIANKMLSRERKAHTKLRLELLREQISKANEAEGSEDVKTKVTKNLNRKFRKEKIPTIIEKKVESNQPIENCDDQEGIADESLEKPEKKPRTEFKFEENEFMTLYEDYWILRESVSNLQVIYNKKVQRILHGRRHSNKELPLTADEELELRRLMKKEKRRENRLLKLRLIEEAKSESFSQAAKAFRAKKPGKYLGIDYQTGNDMAKFDGFWIKKEGAERLEGLREKLRSSGVAEDEVQKIIKNERRKEERMLKSEKKQFCFRCRQNGHMVSLCPQSTSDYSSTGVEICFKCGSTEHMARNCPSNKTDSSYSHATCFICNEVGHISRECPDNPKGLYPEGGCCNECGSVEHLKKDCPELQMEHAKGIIKLPSLNSKRKKESIEVEVVEEEEVEEVIKPKIKKHKKQKAKTITF